MKIYKSIKLMLLGVSGIVSNSKIGMRQKCYLFCDLLRLTFYTFYIVTFKQHEINKENTFFITSFNYSVTFKGLLAFLYLFNEIFCIGDYKQEQRLKLYIDCGANIGLSILWYYHFNKKMHTLAFEPSKESFKYLKINLKRNNIKNVKLFNLALSDKSISRKKFYEIKDNIQKLDSSLKLNQKLPYEVSYTKVSRLSDFLGNKKISLLKMDIEGSEYDVLDDLVNTKKINNIDSIIYEAHFFNTKEKNRYIQCVEKLKKIGEIHSQANSNYTSLNYWTRYRR